MARIFFLPACLENSCGPARHLYNPEDRHKGHHFDHILGLTLEISPYNPTVFSFFNGCGLCRFYCNCMEAIPTLSNSFCLSSYLANAMYIASSVCSSPKNSIPRSNTDLAAARYPFCSSNFAYFIQFFVSG